MKLSRHLAAYLNHAALNLGALITCAWYAVIPPQWTGHTARDIESLAELSPWRAFWDGVTG